jgi:hypothetical protein
MILLAACSAAPQASLPTATPAPTQVIPAATATHLPPPTVTPYPTATPGGLPVDPATPEPTLAASSTAPAEPSASPAEPQATATPTPARNDGRGEPLVEITFDRGWPTIQDDQASISLVDGVYRFEIGANARRYVTTGAINATDVYFEIQARPEACPDGGGYGLFFRFVDDENYYALTFFCDNRATVYARSGGDLIGEPLVNTRLRTGLDASSSAPHTIGVSAQGDRFSITFDGQSVANFTSGLHAQGDIALYATSQQTGTLVVEFDDLMVWESR